MARTKQTARAETASRSTIAKKTASAAKAPRATTSAKAPRAAIAKAKVAEAVRKPHRFRPGTVALREIKHEQQSVLFAIRKTPFQRIVREIAEDFGIAGADGVRFARGAIEDLQSATEAFGIMMLSDALGNQVHRKKLMLDIRDLKRAEGAFNLFTAGQGSIHFPGVQSFEDPGRARMLRLAEEVKVQREEKAAARAAEKRLSAARAARVAAKAKPKAKEAKEAKEAEPEAEAEAEAEAEEKKDETPAKEKEAVAEKQDEEFEE